MFSTPTIKYAPRDYTPPIREKCAGPLLGAQYRKTQERANDVLDQLECMCALTFVSDGHSDKSRRPIVNYVHCMRAKRFNPFRG
jgi:hypothetical protein